MLFNWNPALVDGALAVLTDPERRAIDCLMSLNKGKKKPGPVRLRRYGFDSLEDYEVAVAAVREHMKEHFAGLGIKRVDDLKFEEPRLSTEGRLKAAAALRKET